MTPDQEIEWKLSIWRHWIWADRMRELFVYYLRTDFPELATDDIGTPGFFSSSMVTAMTLWYGLLEVTCQAIKASGLADLDAIAPSYHQVRARLREFRNAAFHVQPKWWSPKLAAVLREPEDASLIRAVHDAVGAWLRLQFPEEGDSIEAKGA